MGNNNINYTELGKERIITVADLIIEIFRRFLLVILSAVIFAVLLGGYKYVKDTRSARQTTVQIEEEAEVDTGALSEDELTAVNNLLYVQDNLNELQEYVNHSILMQIDAYNEGNVVLQYHLQALDTDDDSDYSQSLIQLYEGFISNGSLASSIIDKGYDLDIQYLGELISYTVDSETDESEDGLISVNASTTINLKIIQTDEESAQALADIIIECMDEYKETLDLSVGEHVLTLVDRSYANVVDKSLWTYKLDRVNSIVSMQDKIETLKADMTSAQIAVFEQYCEQKQDVSFSERETGGATGAVSVSISKKYVVFGAGVGIVLACLFIIFSYILRGSINTANDLRYLYNLRVLGEVNESRKKHIFILIWNKIIGKKVVNLSLDQQKELLLSNLIQTCRENGITKLLLSGSIEYGENSQIGAFLSEKMKVAGVDMIYSPNPAYSAKAIAMMKEYDAVVFIEKVRESRYETIEEVLRICQEHGVVILGAIVVE